MRGREFLVAVREKVAVRNLKMTNFYIRNLKLAHTARHEIPPKIKIKKILWRLFAPIKNFLNTREQRS